MIHTSKLTQFLCDAISDYASHAVEVSPSEWLNGYLGEKLHEKSAEAINSLSSEIIDTLGIMEEKQAELDAAFNNGQSAENWFTDNVMADSDGNGSKARMAAEFFNGVSAAESTYDENIYAEVIDITDEVWTDDEWNDYKLKDTLKGVAAEAGKAGLREIAADAFIKATEDGLPSLIQDSEFVQQTIEKGAVTGLKVAISAGLAVAEDAGVLPPTAAKVIAATAHNTVESLKVFRDVAAGRSTMTEAVIKVKNTAISTFGAMWQQYKGNLTDEITNAVGTVFGVKGAVISGAVIGLVTPPQEGSRIMNAVKGAAKATWSFLTKERHLPSFNKIKNTLSNLF